MGHWGPVAFFLIRGRTVSGVAAVRFPTVNDLEIGIFMLLVVRQRLVGLVCIGELRVTTLLRQLDGMQQGRE